MRRLPFLLLAVTPGVLAAQQVWGTPAAHYLSRYQELVGLGASGQVMKVHHLVLARDAGTLTLEDGSLYLLKNLDGHTVGAVFEGTGHFTLLPPFPTERAELRRFAGSDSLDDDLSEAVLLFADSTTDQLLHVGSTAGAVPEDVDHHAADFIGTLKGKNEGAFDWGVIGPFLNGERNGLFVARLKLGKHGDTMFEIDPTSAESVQLYRPARRAEFGAHWDLVTQFTPPGAPPATGNLPQRLEVTHYLLDCNLNETFAADLDLVASGTVSLKADQTIGPWIPFVLQYKVQVDSGHWNDGSKLEWFKAKDSGLLWVRAPRRLAPGDTTSFHVSYHADHPDLIDRSKQWFFMAPGTPWYPENESGDPASTFDVTFHSPHQYAFAAVGLRTDSSLSGKVVTTHWVIARPTPWATFNLGVFENHHVQDPNGAALDVMLSEEAHQDIVNSWRQAGYYIPQQSHMVENVTTDVSNSLKYYSTLFGPPPSQHFYVTEIPYAEGVSFAGLIDLSASTFQFTQIDGFDEFFRAHEVAHQWWGNGVPPATYRDYWLSEGLATFSALWYVAAERRHTDEYFKFLDQYKSDIGDQEKDVGPIWIGPRTSTYDVPGGYQTMIYEKGAWIFHMLRVMMLDTRTMNEDRLTQTMKDYYQTFQGRPATTADFQGVVERHAGIPMDWFFDEWVKGTGMPTYHVAWTNQPGDNNTTVIKFRITQDNVGSDFEMPVLVTADLGENRTARFRIMVKGGKTDYQSPALPAGAKKLVFNDLHSTLANVKMESW